MQLLVELFDDHEIMHNLFAPHGFRPEAVAFLTDPEEDGDQAKKICAALRKRYPWMDVFVCPVCYTDFSSIQAALSALYALYPRPVFELSGGNGIARILAERFCAEHDLPRFLTWEGPVLTLRNLPRRNSGWRIWLGRMERVFPAGCTQPLRSVGMGRS